MPGTERRREMALNSVCALDEWCTSSRAQAKVESIVFRAKFGWEAAVNLRCPARPGVDPLVLEAVGRAKQQKVDPEPSLRALEFVPSDEAFPTRGPS